MRQGFKSEHWNDADGNPEGGVTFGTGFTISWQHGPLGRGMCREAPNGAFVEDIIAAAKDRLDYYQASKFASSYNAEAILFLENALESLNRRTTEREKRNVEGTHAK